MLKQLLISAAMGVSLAGCTASLDTDTNGGYRGQDDVVYRGDRYDHDRYDRSDRPLYGVENNPRPSMAAIDAGVPREAREILNDRGRGDISYPMPHPGDLYVFDRDRGRLVFSGRLHEGERFTVDRSKNRGFLNNREIFDVRGHFDSYRFYVLFDGMR
jgi:hypothetical protein